MFKNMAIALLILGSLQGTWLQAMVAEKKLSEIPTAKKKEIPTFHIAIVNRTNTGYWAFDLLTLKKTDIPWEIPAGSDKNFTIEGIFEPNYYHKKAMLRLDSKDQLHNLLLYATYPLSNEGSTRINKINLQLDLQDANNQTRLASGVGLDLVNNSEFFITIDIEGSYPDIRASIY
jgi:hypothetical protein